MGMTNWLELLKYITIIFFVLGIVITIIICHLESKYYERRKANNNTGAQTMYAHEEDSITEAEKDRLETLFKIMKALITIAVVAFALYGIVALGARFNAYFANFSNIIK